VSVYVEQLVAQACRRYLLSALPAKVAEVNATRAPVLEAAYAGPYSVTGTKVLSISKTGVDTGYVQTAALATGTRTAADIATEINATSGLAGVASADTDGRLLLTGSAPEDAANGIIAVKGTAAGLFGWATGDRVVHSALVAPTYRGVADGVPLKPDMGPGIWIIIGKRSSVPVRRNNSTVRTFEYQVGLELGLMWREMNVQSHRSREAIQSCVRCVRELLLTQAGRQFGRAGVGDIVLVEEKTCTIEGVPYAFKGKDAPPGIFDRALMMLSVRAFERAAS
jgi:hypothetical protein